MSAHTPGPWRVGRISDGYSTAWVMAGGKQLVADVIRAADAPSFQFCVGPADEGEASANARLIAAAPSLLEACRRLLTFNEELCTDVGISRHYPSAEMAREAIAKATGEASS